MRTVQGKIALVTGAGQGIGRGVAELLAERGAEVVLVARTASALEEVAAGIRTKGGKATVIPGDLTDDAFIEALFRQVADTFGRLDILVNNAGIAYGGPVDELDADVFRSVMELNVTAAFKCMQGAIRLMKSAGNAGKIINISSICGHWITFGGSGVYHASKFALRAMTEAVAKQMKHDGVNIAVGIVSPGNTDTPLMNPNGEPRPDWLHSEDVAEAVFHAVTAPDHITVFETILMPIRQDCFY